MRKSASKIKVKVFNVSKNNLELPEYKTSGSAGLDLRADISGSIVIRPGMRMLIPTGLRLGIPDGIYGGVYSRSGLSLKVGLINANGTGIIDSDYKGEVGIIAYNISDKDVTINTGDRIAQIIFQKYESIEWDPVDSEEELGVSERGSNGYGHSGVK